MANLVVNSVDDTKLPCCTLLLMQHHSFFRNLPPLFIYPYLHGTRHNYHNVLILKTNCTIFFNQTAFPSRMLEQSNAAICALKLLSTALQMRWAFTLTLSKSFFCSFVLLFFCSFVLLFFCLLCLVSSINSHSHTVSWGLKKFGNISCSLHEW